MESQNLSGSHKAHQPIPIMKVRGRFEIPKIHLEGTDRRLLSSSIESLLYHDEELTLSAISFFRDILLADFPPETFIQESALNECLLQILKQSWEDPMVTYVAFQSFLVLIDLLSVNIGFLNSTEFYQKCSQADSHDSSSGMISETSDLRQPDYTPIANSSSASSEYFFRNFFKLLSGISRTLTYKPENTYLWLLLERCSMLIQQYLTHYKTPNTTALYLNLEEILLDISQTFLRHVGSVNPAIVATIFSSLLSNFNINDTKLLTADVRRAIWALASNTQLSHPSYIAVRNHFIQKALPFEYDLKKALDASENDTSAEMFRSASWWKLDVINEQRAWKDVQNNNLIVVTTETDILPELLYFVQNAVDHQTVFEGIEKLWLYFVPLFQTIKDDQGDSEGNDNHFLKLSKRQWRETFYRFVSVEPTSSEDVDLLSRVLDLLSFLLKWMKNTEPLLDWIIPLVTEKNSAILRLMYQESVECISNAGPHLTTLNSSMFIFCQTILLQATNSNQHGEFFNTCAEILKVSYETEFPSRAILQVVLKFLANLIPTTLIREKLNESPEVTISLVEIITNAVQSLLDKTVDDDGSYRNVGTLKHSSLILVQLSDILVQNRIGPFWISHYIPILPRLWALENVLIRVAALQICSNITSVEGGLGVSALISQLESPTLLWRFAYTRLTDSTESSIVKQRAAATLNNVINHWDQMKTFLGSQLDIPRIKLLEEIVTMLNICWSSSLSELDATNQSILSNQTTFITPNVLSLVSTLIVRVIQTASDEQLHILQENVSLLREVCLGLLRVLGSFNVQELLAQNLEPIWCEQSLISLTNSTQALVYVMDLNSTLPLILISSVHNLSRIVSYFSISSNTGLKSKSTQITFDLCQNTFVLLSTIMMNSGQNFEDLERLIWDNRNLIFGKLVEWLQMKVPSEYRSSALEFLSILLRLSYQQRLLENVIENSTTPFCQVWNQPETYGSAIAQTLLKFFESSTDSEERSSILHCLNHLYLLSPTTKVFVIQNQIVKILVEALREFGIKAVDLQCNNKKNLKSLDQLKWLLTTLTTLFHNHKQARIDAQEHKYADVLHILFKLIKTQPDPSLLHVTIECLINFTAEFPEGSHSLTLTNGMVGVTSRKISSPNSLYTEILGIIQSDLDSIDRNPNLNMRTIELLLSFVSNTSCSQECRSILVKGRVLNFITKFHHTEIRKWSLKYPQVKNVFLKNLLQLTIWQDVQLALAKIPDSIAILVTLAKNETSPNRICALQILRNLTFHSGNRPRLLNEGELLRSLAWRLTETDALDELECIGVSLWAMTANSEKGKVVAKMSACQQGLVTAIQRLKAKLHSLSSEDPSIPVISNLIVLLEKVHKVQTSNNGCDASLI